MPALVGDIVSSAIQELSHVPGIATQIYSSPRIRQYVQNAYLLEIQEMWWPEYMYYQQVSVDGSTGAITSDLQGPLSYIDDYGDIAGVYAEDRNRRLREFPQYLNPFAHQTGRNQWYITPSYAVPHRPFIVYPPQSTGTVVVWARQRNRVPFQDTDTVYLDALLLMYDACWMYATDDSTAPAQVNRFQLLAQKRRTQMKASYAQQPLELDPRFPTDTYMITTEDSGWFTVADPALGVLA